MSKRPIHETKPIAPLKLLIMENCMSLGTQIDEILLGIRQKKESYLVQNHCHRFGSGEGKATIKHPIRGTDLYILADITDQSCHYYNHDIVTYKYPDDHFQDLKRLIAACNGHPHRINVIIPFLYEGRQDQRSKLESLDCAVALQELASMGVENIITFDAHDARVQNAIPLHGFDDISTIYQFIRALLETIPDLNTDSEHLMIISPDEGGLNRAMYYATVLGVNMGVFYKRRDYKTTVNGKNPVVAHEYLGADVANKDILIVDDMIATGESVLEVACELKKRQARSVYVAVTFGLFTDGIQAFDEAYEKGILDYIFLTNLSYTPQRLLLRPYYQCVNMSNYIALIIDTLNKDASLNDILDPYTRIHQLIAEHKERKAAKLPLFP